MTFYKKWYMDVTNYGNTHAIYKFIFRNIRGIYDLSMFFKKHPWYTRFSNVFLETSVLYTIYQCVFQNLNKFPKISKQIKKFHKISKIKKFQFFPKFQNKLPNFQKFQKFHKISKLIFLEFKIFQKYQNFKFSKNKFQNDKIFKKLKQISVLIKFQNFNI